MTSPVTVAIPVRNGGSLLLRTLAAVRAQRLDRPVELLVADSGSSDGSADAARRCGARVLSIDPDDYSHGGTRRLLAESASGSHVAFLTQDATPADERWLERMLSGFELAADVALVYGPYRPRAGASTMVRRELEEWFRSLSPDGAPRVQRGVPAPADVDRLRHLFFTDANGCVEREALERVPFRDVAYAEDQQLARDMLAAGYAKAFVPDAAVLHSHEYTPLDVFRRSFDEWRGLRAVHGAVAPAGPLRAGLQVQRQVRDDLARARADGASGRTVALTAAVALRHHALRAAGAALGSRAASLPPVVRRACSLERRAGNGG